MRAMIFAAGLGTRLRPLSDVIPKPLAPVGPWPLVRYAVETAKAAGISSIAMNVHHLPDALPAEFGDGARLGVSIRWSREEGPILGTAGGLRPVRDFLVAEGDFAVLNGDTLIDFDLRRAIEHHRATGAVATMVLKDDPRVATFGAIGHADGRVWDFVGRAPVPAGAPPLAKALFTGVQVFSPEVFDFIAPEGEVGLGTDTYPALLRAGKRVSCVLQQGYWNDLGTAERLFEANLDVITRQATFSRFDPLAGFAEGPPGVFFGDSAMRGPGVRLHRPSLIGAGATLDARATIGPEAFVGADAVIESGVSVTRALVLPRSTVTRDVAGAIVAGDRVIPL